MDFVLTLHSHLPAVLGHGRWPHGSDWLCEAIIDTYLPLLEALDHLERDGVGSPMTIGITPVLANQLADQRLASELEYFLNERLRACDEALPEIEGRGEGHLVPLVHHWHDRLERLRRYYDSMHGDILGAFRRHWAAERIELIGGAATHGYLPLLARDESARLQLMVGFDEHQRLFGAAPPGCWLPECAYRPPNARWNGQVGVETFVAEAGFGFFFVDSHLAAAGQPLGAYPGVPLGVERFDGERHDAVRKISKFAALRTPYHAYLVSTPPTKPVYAFVRDPASTRQVWSRDLGYPGDESYLEFHKIRWPGGLKLWKVTGPGVDLGDKQPYDPLVASHKAGDHAAHFCHLLGEIAQHQAGTVVVAPFDTELFGHWWFEGVEFLEQLYRKIAHGHPVTPVVASGHLARTAGANASLRLIEGSWGANGDHSMWDNQETHWTWERLHPLERRFWDLAPAALEDEHRRPILAAAARQLLLAQSSDWQFIISTGVTADYGTARFIMHADAVESLLNGLQHSPSAFPNHATLREVREVNARDRVFPNVLSAVERVLQRRRA